MMNIKVWTMSLGSWMAATFTICVLGGVIAPDLPIPHRTLELLLPAFRWISWGSFMLGLVETFVFGAYAGWLLASLHNFFARRWGTTRQTFDSRAA